MSQLTVIERARLYLDKVPPAISGSKGHEHTLLTARAIVRGYLIHESDALVLLEEWNQKNEEKWSVKELEHKIRSVLNGPPPKKGDGYLLDERDERPQQMLRRDAPRVEAEKPVYRAEKLEVFAGEWARRVDLCWLADRSVVEPYGVGAEEFLKALYRPQQGEKVVVFDSWKSQGQAMWPDETVPLDGPEGVWFLAQPVDGQYRPSSSGEKMSRRSKESVLAWRYLVLESDEAPPRAWLGALAQLPLRIAAIYTSGSRSVHALIRVDARTKREWDEIKHALAPGVLTLGADPGSLSAVRLTRLPGCLRYGTEKKGVYTKFPRPGEQKLLYLNPQPSARALVDVLPRRDVRKKWADRIEMLARNITAFSVDEVREMEGACRYYGPVCPALAGHVVELGLIAEDLVAAGAA